MARLLIDVLQSHREKARFQMHEFVVMPDHIHVLLTPAAKVSLEKCVQFIKGGFSFRAGKELGFTGEVWQSGYNQHRIKDARDFQQHALYIRENPVRKHLCEAPDAYAYSSAGGDFAVNPVPEHLRG
jgi:putative transposase